MTAIGICQGLEVASKLKIDSSLSEVLSAMIFGENSPMDSLFVKSKNDLAKLVGLELPASLELDYGYDKYKE